MFYRLVFGKIGDVNFSGWNTSFGSWALNVVRVIYLINLTGQKQYVTDVKWIWLIIVYRDSLEIIFSPDLKPDDYQINYVNIDLGHDYEIFLAKTQRS